MTTEPPLGLKRHVVITTSRIRFWWLTKVRGYRQVEAVHSPREWFFGMIIYRSRWVLTRAATAYLIFTATTPWIGR